MWDHHENLPNNADYIVIVASYGFIDNNLFCMSIFMDPLLILIVKTWLSRSCHHCFVFICYVGIVYVLMSAMYVWYVL